MDLAQRSSLLSARQLATAQICRGAARLLTDHGLAPVPEVALGNGRRADLAAVSATGEIWIVEIKSCIGDFRADHKWQDYRILCDRFFFAVARDFPAGELPPDAGLIIADRFGGEIIRPALEHRLAGARRKALTLRLLRTAALRLQSATDPEADRARLVR